MKRQPPAENTARVIALAIAFFGSLALLGWSAGVFAKLDEDELWILGGFVVGFAVLTYALDSQVRATARRAAGAVRDSMRGDSAVTREAASSPGASPGAP